MPSPGVIATRAKESVAPAGTNNATKQGLNEMIATILDKEHMRARFEELLGRRTPQFLSSIVTLLNADNSLKQAFFDSPMTIIQSALKAASYDLPIDASLGFAYIVPFRDGKTGKMQAEFIMGYKGLLQLAMRSGAYRTINVTDIREGELVKYNRLTEEIEIRFIEDENRREETAIAGYAGHFTLVNGMTKTVYMSIAQIKAHEQKHRKGQYMGKGWRDDFNAMASKTVMRNLIGKWGLMSIDYQQANPQMIAAAEAIATGRFDDEDQPVVVDIAPDNSVIVNEGQHTQQDAPPSSPGKNRAKTAGIGNPEILIPLSGEHYTELEQSIAACGNADEVEAMLKNHFNVSHFGGIYTKDLPEAKALIASIGVPFF